MGFCRFVTNYEINIHQQHIIKCFIKKQQNVSLLKYHISRKLVRFWFFIDDIILLNIYKEVRPLRERLQI